MNSDGKIYITISDKREDGQNGGVGGGIKKTSKESAPDQAERLGEMQMFSFVKGQAKQFMNYSLQNIGNFTGNYEMQNEINATMGAMNSLIGIASSFAVGGIVGGMIAIAGAGINAVYQEHSLYIANKQQNRQISMIRQLSGMNALIDESRGTQG